MRSEVVTKKIRIAAWAMLIAQAGIILTGGIVRLTGSGLGCSCISGGPGTSSPCDIDSS